MAQQYTDNLALERMAGGHCPECGQSPESHLNDPRFWMPRACDLLPRGVEDRIAEANRGVQSGAQRASNGRPSGAP